LIIYFADFFNWNNNGLRKVLGPPEMFVDPSFLPTGCIFDLEKIMQLFFEVPSGWEKNQ
jgi:hypothetical protein